MGLRGLPFTSSASRASVAMCSRTLRPTRRAPCQTSTVLPTDDQLRTYARHPAGRGAATSPRLKTQATHRGQLLARPAQELVNGRGGTERRGAHRLSVATTRQPLLEVLPGVRDRVDRPASLDSLLPADQRADVDDALA